MRACMHHGIVYPHAVSYLIAFCLLSSGQAKENRIWSSFIWNFSLFPSSGAVPEKWGVTQNPKQYMNQRAVVQIYSVAKHKSRMLNVYKPESQKVKQTVYKSLNHHADFQQKLQCSIEGIVCVFCICMSVYPSHKCLNFLCQILEFKFISIFSRRPGKQYNQKRQLQEI